eukprot:g1614.t1
MASEGFGASVLQLKESYVGNVQTRIRNYGTAVTVGVFIGAALTTGICAGIAGWWTANQSSVFAFLNTVTETVVTAATNATPGRGSAAEDVPLENKDSQPLRPGTVVARSTYLTVEEQTALHHSVLALEELQQRVAALETRLRKSDVGPGSKTEVSL